MLDRDGQGQEAEEIQAQKRFLHSVRLRYSFASVRRIAGVSVAAHASLELSGDVRSNGTLHTAGDVVML